MSKASCQVDGWAGRQHGVVAGWQLARDFTRREIAEALRGLRRVHRGVCAVGDLTELGWYMAAALAMGPSGAVSHLSALMLLGLRPYVPGDIHVSHIGGGRGQRPGLRTHRRRELDVGTCNGIPVTSPTQSLRDANLKPYELYRALEEADRRTLHIDRTHLLKDVVHTQQAVKGRTRSDAEARFILLCHDHKLPLPLVNHQLNGIETDFHWPRDRIVVEVDGYEFHSSKPQFEEDRRRGLVHTAAGYTVVRVSALQVKNEADLVVRALRQTTGW
jgi:very-short-patch-repair endonuclease